MVAENDDMPIGWPLGLGFLSMRLRIVDSLPGASVVPYQLDVPSTSFSSFSSSNLDTEFILLPSSVATTSRRHHSSKTTVYRLRS
ncbi:uncharacterized protein LOC113853167 isoform X2 [Abrus precatorius]|uniref:Uncharacterized protein LOC113853167 isoform X2 n=1 Tax=Abrus precatorius TaxID=3816 RepID=A0A8B8K6Y9_ABRPR|nr:uncharacterized protein LOC113853167 isoform X2 [Abrus precatorius]